MRWMIGLGLGRGRGLGLGRGVVGLLSCVWVAGCGCLQERGAVGWVDRLT